MLVSYPYRMGSRKVRQTNLFSRMPSLLNQIRKNNANMNKNESRVEYMKKRVVELGANEKKEFLPFKDGLKKIEEKRERKKFERMQEINTALVKKRRFKRRR